MDAEWSTNADLRSDMIFPITHLFVGLRFLDSILADNLASKLFGSKTDLLTSCWPYLDLKRKNV